MNLLEGVHCAVFDIDDTLYLERDYVRSGFEAVGQFLSTELRVEGFAEQAWAAFEAGRRGNTFDVVLSRLGVSDVAEIIARLVGIYRAHTPTISLLDDAKVLVDQLRNAGISLAVITDGPQESQAAKAAALGVASWADPVILTSRLGQNYHKPSRLPFKMVQDHFGMEGRDCVYVADNPHKDFAGPKELGWRTVRVRRPLGLHFDVESGAHVDSEVTDLIPLVGSRAKDTI